MSSHNGSEQRSSSAVRNLKALFENKDSTPAVNDSRGRSSSGSGEVDTSGVRPASKIRASFIPVETRASFIPVETPMAVANAPSEAPKTTGPADTNGDNGKNSLGRVKSVSESIGRAKPMKEPGRQPEKPTKGAEAESVIKPADASAVSGALPPAVEDRTAATKKDAPAKKSGAPAKLATNGAKSVTTSKTVAKPPAVKSPTRPKTPPFGKSMPSSSKTESAATTPAKIAPKKTGRSSLAAHTATSLARSGQSTSAKATPVPPAKAREPTKPVSLPSHLTAPTAASRAKHDPEPSPTERKPPVKPSSTAASAKAKPPPGPRSTPRTSLAPPQTTQRPGSRSSQTSSPRRSTGPVNGGFLERMTRPTAASASRTIEKPEVKSPPRPARTQATHAPAKSKVGGTHAPAAAAPEEKNKMGEARDKMEAKDTTEETQPNPPAAVKLTPTPTAAPEPHKSPSPAAAPHAPTAEEQRPVEPEPAAKDFTAASAPEDPLLESSVPDAPEQEVEPEPAAKESELTGESAALSHDTPAHNEAVAEVEAEAATEDPGARYEDVAAPAEYVAAPADEDVAAPADEDVAAPADEGVAAPADEGVAAPADEGVAAPADDDVAAPADEGVAAPADEGVAAPADDDVAAPADEGVAAPAGYVAAPADAAETAVLPLTAETPANADVDAALPLTAETPANTDADADAPPATSSGIASADCAPADLAPADHAPADHAPADHASR